MSDYTPEMVAAITKAAPLTFEKAQEIAASDMFSRAGKGYRSVIAKAKPAKKSVDNGPTKAATLSAIRAALALPDREGDLTKAELSAVLENIA